VTGKTPIGASAAERNLAYGSGIFQHLVADAEMQTMNTRSSTAPSYVWACLDVGGDHSALAKTRSAVGIRSNRCPNPAPFHLHIPSRQHTDQSYRCVHDPPINRRSRWKQADPRSVTTRPLWDALSAPWIFWGQPLATGRKSASRQATSLTTCCPSLCSPLITASGGTRRSQTSPNHDKARSA
jgi:hypothetical protein